MRAGHNAWGLCLVSEGVLTGGQSGADARVGILEKEMVRRRMVRDSTEGKKEERKTHLGDILVGLLESTEGELLSGLGDLLCAVLDRVGGGLASDREGREEKRSDKGGGDGRGRERTDVEDAGHSGKG